jgi:hypothetical protein
LRIEGYCDADWAGCVNDRRTTTNYCVHVGDNLVAWRNKKQDVIAKSSAEAEYRAMALSLCEMMWVKSLLSELRLFRGEPLQYGMIVNLQSILQTIRSNMIAPSM